MGGKWRNKISNPSLLIKRNIIRLCDSCCISTSLILHRILFYMHCADTHNNIIHLHTCTSIPLSLLYKLSHTHTRTHDACVHVHTNTHTHVHTVSARTHLFPFFSDVVQEHSTMQTDSASRIVVQEHSTMQTDSASRIVVQEHSTCL